MQNDLYYVVKMRHRSWVEGNGVGEQWCVEWGDRKVKKKENNEKKSALN